MEKSSFKLKPFLPALGWSLFILLVSWNAGGLNLPQSLFDLVSTDKAAHVVVYGILSWLMLNGLNKIRVLTPLLFVLTIVWCSAYGILMEVLQYKFFPGRYFEWADELANIIGAFLGLAVFIFLPTFRTKFS